MKTAGYVFMLLAVLAVRAVAQERSITQLPNDIGDIITAAVAGDYAAVKEVFSRRGDGRTPSQVTVTEDGKTKGEPSTPGNLVKLRNAPGHKLADGAAQDFDRLADAFAAQFKKPLKVTDSFRTYADQVALKAAKPKLAGEPGTSLHEKGRAVDLGSGVEKFTTREHEWMDANAGKYGWVNPAWARKTGNKPEPWHWEHV